MVEYNKSKVNLQSILKNIIPFLGVFLSADKTSYYTLNLTINARLSNRSFF